MKAAVDICPVDVCSLHTGGKLHRLLLLLLFLLRHCNREALNVSRPVSAVIRPVVLLLQVGVMQL